MTREAAVAALARSMDGAEVWALEFPEDLSQDAKAYLREMLAKELPDKRVVVVDGGARFRALMPLDAAWAAVEAVLPEGWEIALRWIRWDETWIAEARGPKRELTSGELAVAYGPNPAVALLSLAERLAQR